MPNLYGYKGFIFYLYSNDHANNPKHCHVKKEGKQVKVVFNEIGGVFLPDVMPKSKKKFKAGEIETIGDFSREYALRIIQKIDKYISDRRKPKFEKVNKI